MDGLQRLQSETARCLARHEHHGSGRALLAAVSGGVDSTVLAMVLARLRDAGRLPGEPHVVHVDHGTRPDSRANAELVVDLAERLRLPVTVRRLELGAGASEDAMRKARYRVLQEVAGGLGTGLLLTAHHADDNIETVLFRMLRGSGPRGLAGIPEARWLPGAPPLLLVRPFLRQRRATLEAIVARHGLPVYLDRTNLDPRPARNRLRLQTIPALRASLGVGLDAALLTVARTARAATEILQAQGLRLLTRCGTRVTPWRWELDLRGLDPASRPFLEEALRQVHGELHRQGGLPLQRWVERAMAVAARPDGTRLHGRGGLLVERTRQGLLLLDPARAGAPPSPRDAGGPELAFDAGRLRFGATEWWLQAHAHPQPPLLPTPRQAGRLRALLDPRLLPRPWRLRARRPGDRFRPLGATQSVDLRRFLQRRHVPRFDRDRIPLLVDATDRILWVPGVEIAHFARLLPGTRRTVEVRAGRG